MAGKKLEINLPRADSLFSSQAEREDTQREKVMDIPLSQLHEFPNHPFHVREDEAMQRMTESVGIYGVLVPALVRPRDDGGYEMVSGHRRRRAGELAGLHTLPCIVRNLTDDEAVIVMVDSNLQREHIFPSEKAFAYKMKLEAMKRQGERTDLTSVPMAQKLERKTTREILGNQAGESQDQVRRFIRLTHLISPILDMVDENRMAFRPAVELSYLTEAEQANLYDVIQQEDCTPSLAQAAKMKQFSQQGRLNEDVICSILSEEKGNQKESIRFPAETLRKYIPPSVPMEKTHDYVLKALEHYQKAMNRKRAAMER